MQISVPPPRISRRAPRWPLFAGAALPAVLAVTFHALGPTAQSAVPRGPRPALVFERYLIKPLEEQIEVQSTHGATFVFTNTGDHPVHIDKIESSCGCLQPQMEQDDYQPGESGQFVLRVQTANQTPGPKEYYCRIYYTDPEPRETKVTFELVLPEQTMTVQPKAMIVYLLSPEPVEHEMLVTNYASDRLNVLNVTCSSEYATVALGPQGRDHEGNPRRVINVTVQSAPPGKHTGVIQIETDDSRFPVLRVPLFIQSTRAGSEAE